MDNREAKRFAASICHDLIDAMTEDYVDYHILMWQRENEEFLTAREKERIYLGIADIKRQLLKKKTKTQHGSSKSNAEHE